MLSIINYLKENREFLNINSYTIMLLPVEVTNKLNNNYKIMHFLD